MAISQQASRFALLKIEDDQDSDEEVTPSAKQQHAKGNKEQAANKKKNKKKRNKDQGKQETAQLQTLAFGSANVKKGASQNGHHPQSGHKGRGAGDVTDQQWDEWRKLDSEQTTETYERDLQQALLLSKLEQEEQKKSDAQNGGKGSGATSSSGNSGNSSSKSKKKNKKKEKPAAMSLDQFNQMPVIRSQSKEEDDEPEYEILPAAAKPNASLPKEAEPDKAYFDKVDKDVQKIIRQEQIQEEYRKQYAMENARSAQYKSEIEKRDKEIVQLKQDNKGLTEELQQVKKRNQQLCHILSQGEMKDKASVQLELEQLQQAHTELTEQVTQLTEELEKERSRGHGLKAENDKLKGGKHK